jgi:hypothetical protein
MAKPTAACSVKALRRRRISTANAVTPVAKARQADFLESEDGEDTLLRRCLRPRRKCCWDSRKRLRTLSRRVKRRGKRRALVFSHRVCNNELADLYLDKLNKHHLMCCFRLRPGHLPARPVCLRQLLPHHSVLIDRFQPSPKGSRQHIQSVPNVFITKNYQGD